MFEKNLINNIIFVNCYNFKIAKQIFKNTFRKKIFKRLDSNVLEIKVLVLIFGIVTLCHTLTSLTKIHFIFY